MSGTKKKKKKVWHTYCLTVSTFPKFKLVRTGNIEVVKIHLATKYFDLAKARHKARSRRQEWEQEKEN